MTNLTEQLSELAAGHGAAGFGVTGVAEFDRERITLRSHRENGLSGPLRFTYDDPDVATDVTRSVPWARSLVVVSWGYLSRAGTPAELGAVVGRFATGDNYEGLRRITDALADHLRASGYRAETLIDDNRLLDRAAAIRAGLGWSGKSTMVLAPGHGPWMLLGTVVTDAALGTSDSMQRDCGTCVACIPACPTAALGDWGLDARRCLSTWLQTAGSVPQWIRPRMGRRVYGCDDCLTACPPGGRALAAAGEKPLHLPFAELLALDDDALLDRFRWWYVPRRQGRFIRRNLLVAAGNAGEPGAHGALEAHLGHPSSMIRGHAAWALARGYAARDLLRDAFDSETVSEPYDEVVLALLMIEHPKAHQALLAADERAHMDERVRGLALVGPHAAAEGGAERPEFVFVGDDPDTVNWPSGPMVRVYDPDRMIERLCRERAGT